MRRKTGNGNGNGYRTNRSNPTRSNASRVIRANQSRVNQTDALAARIEVDLADQIDDLKNKNARLKSKLDDMQGTIDDAVDVLGCSDPECSDADHLDELRDILDVDDAGNGNGDGDDNE